MIELNEQSIQILNDEIEQILDEKDIDFDIKKLIRMRYGLDSGEPCSFKELKKEFKISSKKLKEKVAFADKKVFNLLKN